MDVIIRDAKTIEEFKTRRADMEQRSWYYHLSMGCILFLHLPFLHTSCYQYVTFLTQFTL